MIGERSGGSYVLTVDAAFARRRRFLSGRGVDTRAEGREAKHAFDFGRNCPSPITFRKRELFHGGAAQAAPGGEEGDSLDQIRFARTVRAGENDRAGTFELNLRSVVAAKIREQQALDKGGGHSSSS